MKTNGELQRDAWSELWKLLEPCADPLPAFLEQPLAHTAASADKRTSARISGRLKHAR